MKKTIIKLILIVLILVNGICPLSIIANAETTAHGTCGVNLTWTYDYSTGELVISGNGKMTNWSDEYGGRSPWNSNYGWRVKSVVINKGVETIGNYAFDGCNDLESVSIYGVTSIGSYAFYSCDNLANIVIPETTKSIGQGAFSWCSKLNSITIASSVSIVEERAFFMCSSLKEVYYTGSNVAWKKISIGNNNEKLTNANITYAKYEREVINSGSCGDNMTWTFYGDGLLSIQGRGVMNYSGAWAPWYGYRESITKVSLGENVATISKSAFSNLEKLETVDLPRNLKIINDDAFSGCKSLEKIVLPASVISIGWGVFDWCESLTEIYSNGENYVSVDGVLYNKNKTALIKCPEAKIGKCVMPDTVTNIGRFAFANCEKLTEVELSDNLEDIREFAFYYCSSLEEIHLPQKVTHIYPHAFQNCDMKNLIFSGNITRIDDEAFSGCTELKNVYIPDLTEWCKLSFLESNSTDIENPLYYAENLYVDGILIKELVIPYGVTEIGNGAFYGFSGFETLKIPETVTDIGMWAFADCDNLKTVYLPESLEYINGGIFVNCQNLDNVIIPNGVRGIVGLFEGCTNLKTLTLPTSLTMIGESTFSGCSNLSDIYYKGNEAQWEEVYINYNGNEELIALATIHYLCEKEITLQLVREDFNVSTSGITEKCTIILTSCKGGRMLDIKSVTVTEDTTVSIAETGLNISGADEIKAFLWEDIQGMKPLCSSRNIVICD